MAEAEQPTVAVQETTKRERTPAQLEALQRARAKAAEVRAKNTELRRKERELVNAQLEEKRRLREETIQREHAERFHAKEEENTAPAAAAGVAVAQRMRGTPGTGSARAAATANY